MYGRERETSPHSPIMRVSRVKRSNLVTGSKEGMCVFENTNFGKCCMFQKPIRNTNSGLRSAFVSNKRLQQISMVLIVFCSFRITNFRQKEEKRTRFNCNSSSHVRLNATYPGLFYSKAIHQLDKPSGTMRKKLRKEEEKVVS